MFIDEKGVVRKPVAYLADFQMFLPNCKEVVDQWKKTCDKYGIIGLFPSDPAADDQYKPYQPKDDSLPERLYGIFVGDCNQMKRSDMVIAQLDPWRSASSDSGTVFEMGYFIGLGKPAYGFISKDRPYARCYDKETYRDEKGILRYKEDDIAVEERDFPMDNLFQLAKIGSTFEEACKLARADFDRQLIEHGYQPYPVKD